MRAVYLASAMLMLASCQDKAKPDVKPSTPEVKPASAPVSAPVSASVPAATMASAPTSTPASAPATAPSWLEVQIAPFEYGMMDHASLMGWSKDSSEFAFCAPAGGAGGDYCRVYIVAQEKEEKLQTPEESNWKSDKKIKERVDKMGYAHSTAAVSGMSVFWVATPGNAEKEKPLGKFELGVRSPDKKSVTAASMVFESSVEVHPETIEVSPDGKHLAVLVHGYFGEYSDQFQMKVIPIESLRTLLK